MAKPTVVFLAKTSLTKHVVGENPVKLDILGERLKPIFVCVGRAKVDERAEVIAMPNFSINAFTALFFYLVGPIVTLSACFTRGASAVVCKSPLEAFPTLLLRWFLPRRRRPKVLAEIHGDWRTATRLYGGWPRRLVASMVDRCAEWAVRNADAVRVIGQHTEKLLEDVGYSGPVMRYVTFTEFDAFLAPPIQPLPLLPQVAYVGVFEPYKAVDILLEAWDLVALRHPTARLLLIGGGGSQEAAVHRQIETSPYSASIELLPPVSPQELSAILDDCWCLILPSRAEGLGRVVLEAFARARPVVGSDVGGIPEFVSDGKTGLLCPPGDVDALAAALDALLSDPVRVSVLGAAARKAAEMADPLEGFRRGIAEVSTWVSEG